MSLFQWSQVFKNPKWKPMIDVWFGKFRVSIYLKKYHVYLVSLLILMN
jgi:hypothetical protein